MLYVCYVLLPFKPTSSRQPDVPKNGHGERRDNTKFTGSPWAEIKSVLNARIIGNAPTEDFVPWDRSVFTLQMCTILMRYVYCLMKT